MSDGSAVLNGEKIDYGVYYTDGGDVFLTGKAENAFRSLIPSDSLSLFVIDKLFGMDEIFNALNTFSFSGDSNVVIVKDSEYKPTDKEQKALENLEVNDAYLLFINAKFLTAKQKKRFNAINCAKPNKYEAIKYSAEFFPQGIDREALNLLAEYTDCDMARIRLESRKLSDCCGERKITAADIEETVAEDADLQIFSFVTALTEGDKAKALKQLEKLKKRGEAPSFMLASLIGQYRRMLHASLSNKSDSELAALLKVKEYAVKKARSTRNLTKKQIKNTLHMLIDYEQNFKSGEMSEQTAFNAAVSRLVGGEV